MQKQRELFIPKGASVEARIARLERRCRFLTFTLAAIVLAGIGLAAADGRVGSYEQLDVRRLRVTDEKGTARIVAGVSEEGTAMILMTGDGEKGKPIPRLSLECKGDFAKQTFADAANNDRVVIAAGAGSGALMLRDNHGKLRISQITTPEDAAGFNLMDENEKTVEAFESKPKATTAKPAKKK